MTAPDGREFIRDRDGVKYLKISFVEEKRWVLDIMYGSGARRTYDLVDGQKVDRPTMIRSILPDSEHPSHQHASTAVELTISLFGSPVRLTGCGIEPTKGTSLLDLTREWDRAILAVMVRKYLEKGCGYEDLAEMLMIYYGVEA